MIDFADFDARRYRTVDVRSGYGEWAATYDRTVEDAMDLELLATLREVPWSDAGIAADLGCGTGRTGTWMRDHGVGAIDGVDLTPEMLERARMRRVYRQLREADIANSGLSGASYDLVVSCLVDEHLAALGPLYAEARRIATDDGLYVLAGYHPQFIMSTGIPTHFDGKGGEPIAIETHVHMFSEHVTAAHASGWSLAELRERAVDDRLIESKPKWARFRGLPISFAFVWRASA